ncbi:MAG: family serine peptidase [Candidatus Brocadiaceae bacterium]|nr:family serine peptidase [Candidatus Brocadiaceae bacterium]
MNPLALVKLNQLMELTQGKSEITIGLIDGPVVMNHPGLASENIVNVSEKDKGSCSQANSSTCMHGTFVASVLSGKRGSSAMAICPDCTLLVRPIFLENTEPGDQIPNATPEDLAEAIIECVDAGARVLNLSVAFVNPTAKGNVELKKSLDYAAHRGVIVVAAAGNQGTLCSSVITSHPWVIPVVACNLSGMPISLSNLGNSIGRRGLSAPGEGVSGIGMGNKPITPRGTSVATPFVTGTVALLWSMAPNATAIEIKLALTDFNLKRRTMIVPPLLDAWKSYQLLNTL